MRAPSRTINKARRLRRTMSPPEARLWTRLRQRTPGQPDFRRQHPLGPYVLDFCCPAAKLAVEIDGWSHSTGDQPRHAEQRDAGLAERGVTTLRIAAAEVMQCFDETVERILQAARERLDG